MYVMHFAYAFFVGLKKKVIIVCVVGSENIGTASRKKISLSLLMHCPDL